MGKRMRGLSSLAGGALQPIGRGARLGLSSILSPLNLVRLALKMGMEYICYFFAALIYSAISSKFTNIWIASVAGWVGAFTVNWVDVKTIEEALNRAKSIFDTCAIMSLCRFGS